MIYLNSYIQHINEISRKDIKLIKSLQDVDLFTIAYEFELITEDATNYLIDIDKYDVIVEDILEEIDLDFGRKEKRKCKSILNGLKEILKDIKNISIKDVYDLINDINDEDRCVKQSLNLLKGELLGTLESPKIIIENIEYLKSNVENYLPNFYNKWNEQLDYVLDASLLGKISDDEEDNSYGRGIEFKPKTYIVSLNKAIEMLDDFYSDFEKQQYWKMNSKTGLHINIGVNCELEWNPLKGMIMLSELTNQKGDTPYIFKDMIYRMNTDFTNSLKIKTIQNIKTSKHLKNTIKKLDIHNLKKLEDIMNPILVDTISKFGVKYFGFNLIHLKIKKYVEFRHIGGNISKDLVIEKLIYFCYIVYLMTTDYKDKDYHKKLYKFLEELV